MTSNRTRYVVAILVVACCFFSMRNMQIFENRPHRLVYNEWYKCLGESVFNYDPKMMWLNVKFILKKCESLESIKKLRLRSYENSDEVKWHILPQHNELSTIITLGVGHDTKAEETLRQNLSSNSKFFGADPMQEINEKMYSKIGRFLPFAVGADAGLFVANVLDESYGEKTVVHVDLVYFLTRILKTKFVDALWMDAEHAEYDMMPFFLRGGELDKNGITICQLNIEIHEPNEVKKVAFREFIHGILEDKRYGIFRPIRGLHTRLYLLNFENEQCVERYIN